MPIIHPPPYSKKNVQWSMYKIVDSKWQPQPPTEEDSVSLPKYKKYKNWVSRIYAQIYAQMYSQSYIVLEQVRIEETRLEEARLEEARLVMNRFQDLLRISRRPPPY